MNRLFYILAFSALLTFIAGPASAAQAPQGQQQASAEYEAVLEEAERARQEAERAREGAVKASEMAREAARRRAEMAREESQKNREESAELSRQREIEVQEMARAREELSKAHRELREASREVARAHRELSRDGMHREIIRHVNLGDRAVIGVVLGQETTRGVKIIGVSPDGPAERAGLQQGDILVSIGGVKLAGDEEGRNAIFDVMHGAKDGDELATVVVRNDETLEFTVTAEQREPRGWQSVIRLPEFEGIEDTPGSRHVIIERIEIPDIDEEAIAAQAEELQEMLHEKDFMFLAGDDENLRHLEIEEFSHMGDNAMREADIWFGLPNAHGLELARINEGLGAYFKTDRGVLVIKAKDDNAYSLRSGDVILSIDSTTVDSPADLMRALRYVDPGNEIEIRIKRDRRDKTLSVVVPENRLGYR